VSKATGFLMVLAAATFGAASSAHAQTNPPPKSATRVTVVEVAPTAHKLAAALSDVLAARPDLGVLVDPDKSSSWFALCVDDETDRCFTNVCKSHKIDLVLRAWASSAAGKLTVSIDFVRPHEHGLQTFEDAGVDASNPEAIHQCAVRAVEKVLGKPSAATSTPPIAVATPDTAVSTPPIVLGPPTVIPPEPGALGTEKSVGGKTSGLRVASYVTVGVGAAALVLGVVEGLSVNSENNKMSTDATANPANVPAELQSAKTSATVADVGLIAGGAAVAAGVVMFFLSPNETPKTVASVGVVNGGPVLAISGKF
jgi:hypothetical protein